MNLIKPKFILALLIFLTITIFAFQPSGKHLFILSGQSNMDGVKPEESFTPVVATFLGADNVIVVKDALSGQPIRRWYKDWALNKESSRTGADLYDKLITKVKAETVGEKIATVSFIWMQGERDAREKFGSIYEESLLGLHQQLVEDFKRQDINFVIGRLNDYDMENKSYPEWTVIRQIQVNVADKDSRFDWINTDDLNDGTNEKGKQINNDLHMSEEGYIVLGKRFAQKSIELLVKNASPTKNLKSYLELKYLHRVKSTEIVEPESEEEK